MKVLIINKWDVEGGAARAAYRLHKALLNSSIKSIYAVNNKQSKDSSVVSLNIKNNISQNRFFDLIQSYYIDKNRTELSNTFFSYSNLSVDLKEIKNIKDFDIINLHWVEHMISPENLQYLLSLNIPIVWTMHDMKPFTGGCHYNSGCMEYKNKCFNCIQLKDNPFNLTNKVLKEKEKLLKDANITLVSPSKWLANKAEQSSVFKNQRIEVIPNAIETDIFIPINKKEAKSKLYLDKNTVVLQFGAQNANEKRKGFEYLIQALNIALKNKKFKFLCEQNKVVILCMGHSSNELKKLSIQTKELGFISDDYKISLAYSATDVFILPTLEDNLPNTMLESFACGTPIIAFDTGGITDIVKNNENGIVVPKYDIKALAKGILQLVFDENIRETYGQAGRDLIDSKYKLKTQADSYINLFKELIENNNIKPNPSIKLNETEYDSIIGYSYRKEIAFNLNKPQDKISFLSLALPYVKRLPFFSLLRKLIKRFPILEKALKKY